MRMFVGVALVLASVSLMTVVAPGASACSGSTASLADGVRDAASVYYARVVAVRPTSVGFLDLQLDVGEVVHGGARAHVSQVIPNQPCEPVLVGHVGVVVLASVDPFRDGRNDIYNLFYVLGPGRTSRAEAWAVLGSSPPATDSEIPLQADRASAQFPFLAIASISFMFAVLYLRRRRVTLPHAD